MALARQPHHGPCLLPPQRPFIITFISIFTTIIIHASQIPHVLGPSWVPLHTLWGPAKLWLTCTRLGLGKETRELPGQAGPEFRGGGGSAKDIPGH